jgi:hypothetical protein
MALVGIYGAYLKKRELAFYFLMAFEVLCVREEDILMILSI